MKHQSSAPRIAFIVAAGAAALAACQSPDVSPRSGRPAADSGATPLPDAGTVGAPPSFGVPDAAATVAPPPSGSGKCAEDVHQAQEAPLDVLLVVDASGSMDELSGADTKWNIARNALRSFVADPKSAGLGVGLELFPALPAVVSCARDAECPGGITFPGVTSCILPGFCASAGAGPFPTLTCVPGLRTVFGCPAGLNCVPVGKCAGSGQPCANLDGPCSATAGDTCQQVRGRCRQLNSICAVGDYGKPTVEIADLPGQAGAITSALAGRDPEGDTPTVLAVDSAVAILGARHDAHPERRPLMILATDGLPGGCAADQTVEAVVARLTMASAGPLAIPTYVIGVFAPDEVPKAQPALTQFAQAGGTQAPFILATGDDLSTRLLAALDQIRGAALACEYQIPPATTSTGKVDYGRVNVRFEAAGATTDIPYVGEASRCDPVTGGWHYDVVPSATATPTRVAVCPATCAKFKADKAGKVDLVFGCQSRVIE